MRVKSIAECQLPIADFRQALFIKIGIRQSAFGNYQEICDDDTTG
jgi:hypothetical protein